MKIFLPEIEVGETEGFSKEKDIFQRAQLGSGLKNLVENAEDPLVIAVDGQWGSGKTTFLKMWAGELRKAGFPVIYFDAFSYDYVDDAFSAIAGQIISLLKKSTSENAGAFEGFQKKALKVGKIVSRLALKVGVRAATVGIGKLEDVEEAAGEIADDLADTVDKYLGELITKQDQQKSTVDAFRQALSDLPALLSKASSTEELETKVLPLIFIVDELDRCRPDFALRILERMKHFFSVPHVHFILGTNLTQLSNSVVSCYGSGIDAHTYLQKFILLVVHLTEKYENGRPETIEKFISYLINAHDFQGKDRELAQACGEEISRIASKQNLSLRTIQRIFSLITISVAFTPSNYWRVAPIITGLSILKVTAPNLFTKAKLGQLRYHEIVDRLALPKVSEVGDSPVERWSQRWWLYVAEPNAPNDIVQGVQESMHNFMFGRDRLAILQTAANDIIDRFEKRS